MDNGLLSGLFRARPAIRVAIVTWLLLASLGTGCTDRASRRSEAQETSRSAVAGCPELREISNGFPPGPGWRTNPSLADVDGDGVLDLAVTTRKGRPPSVFRFAPPTGWVDSSGGLPRDFRPCGVGVDLTDLTGDGKPDLLVADHCSGLLLYQGDGTGGWKKLAHLEHPRREGYNDAAAGDVDGDGDADIVGVAAFTHGLSLFVQEQPARFRRVDSPLPPSGRGFRVRLADLDGDGRLDILTTLEGIRREDKARGAREAKVWLQREGGSWQPVDDLPEEGAYYDILAADWNGDGLPDLALSSIDYQGGVRVYLGTAPGVWREAARPGTGGKPGRLFAGLAAVDFNADGRLDLAAVEHRKPGLAIWMGDGAGGFTECPAGIALEPILAPGWGLDAGDLDHDGHIELVAGFGSEAGGALKAWTTR
jgi:hypothetical protein